MRKLKRKRQAQAQRVPIAVLGLVERFHRQFHTYQYAGYNENALRREFLDTFFTALGWDVANRQGRDEGRRQVSYEADRETMGHKEVPNYTFRIGGVRRFFVEAIKPSVNVAEDAAAAHQLRCYGYSARLPLSVITDFEEFCIYDCTRRPNQGDRAAVGRLEVIGYRDYESRWSELVDLFSPGAVRRGSLGRYLDRHDIPSTRAGVNEDFRRDVARWREALRKGMGLWLGPSRSASAVRAYGRGISHSGQGARGVGEPDAIARLIVDRLVFLRICEDRNIENYGELRGLLDGDDIYPRLCELLRAVEARYRVGAWGAGRGAWRVGRLTPRLKVTDFALKTVIEELYPPACPYEFSVMPDDLLKAQTTDDRRQRADD